ncbi:MAG: hypothetical protein AB1564_04475 [Chloroflexota bacterium]
MSKRNILISLSLPFVLATILACQGGPLASVFATPTPTITPSPLPTPTPVFTPTPTPIPEGIVQTGQADGSILFTDYDGGYQLTIPPGWEIVPITKEDLDDIMTALAESNPQIEQFRGILSQVDPDVFRAFLFDFNANAVHETYITNVNIILDRSGLALGLPLDYLLDSTVTAFGAMGDRISVLGSEEFETASGIPAGAIRVSQKLTTSTGEEVEVYQSVVLVKTEKALLTITFSTIFSLREVTEPEFNRIIDGLVLLEP